MYQTHFCQIYFGIRHTSVESWSRAEYKNSSGDEIANVNFYAVSSRFAKKYHKIRNQVHKLYVSTVSYCVERATFMTTKYGSINKFATDIHCNGAHNMHISRAVNYLVA